MLQFYISIKNNLIIGVVVKKLLWSQNRAHFVEFGVNRLYIGYKFLLSHFFHVSIVLIISIACISAPTILVDPFE
jgi:hypothetical protein